MIRRYLYLLPVFALLPAFSPRAHAVVVTQQVVMGLPGFAAAVGPNSDCSPHLIWSTTYKPWLPPDAEIIRNYVVGFCDDACDLGFERIGFDDCTSGPFTRDVPAGWESFPIRLYDQSTRTNGNWATFSGDNYVTYRIAYPSLPPEAATNIEVELEYPPYDPPGMPGPQVEDCRDVIMSWYLWSFCGGCSERGSPRYAFGIANLDMAVEDVPVWSGNEVGWPLELRMRFSNYGGTEAGRLFGPRWSCAWESSVEVEDATRLRCFTMSGATVFYNQGADGNYHPPPSLEGVIVRTGSVYRLQYPSGWVIQYAPSSGNPAVCRLDAVWDAWSNSVHVTHENDRIHRVWQSSPFTGRALEFQYDLSTLVVTSVVTEAGARREAAFEYDAEGRLVGARDAEDYTYIYGYTNGFLERIAKGGEAPVNRALITYSSTPDRWGSYSSHWVRIENSEGVRKTYTWEFGAVAEKTEGRGTNAPVRRYVVGQAGSRGAVIQAVVDSDGGGRSYGYNDNGRVTNLTDAAGRPWNYTLNDQGRITSITDPDSGTFRYVYDANGCDLLYSVSPDGQTPVSFSYVPDRHCLQSVSNALGGTVTYSYNVMGLVTGIVDGPMSVTMSYNSEGRRTSSRRNGVLSETNRYDAFGRLAWTRNAAGLETVFTYDRLDRVTSRRTTDGGRESVVSNHYDCCFIDQVVDANGQEWIYQFNDTGELEWQMNPRGLVTHFGYDAFGHPTAVSNALEWVSMVYKPEGLLEAIRYPRTLHEGPHDEFRWYDAEGRMVRRRTVGGSWESRTYDGEGRVTGVRVSGDEEWREQGFETVLSNRYDALTGRLAWSRDRHGMTMVSASYNALDMPVTKAYSDGATEAWTYDRWGRTTSFRNRGGNVISNVYDEVGRLARIVDPRGHAVSFGYDVADRVIAATNALGHVQQYAYDGEGRMTWSRDPVGFESFFSYDRLGNMTQAVRQGVATTLTYDELGKVTEIKVGGNTISRADYDAVGRAQWTMTAEWLSQWYSYDEVGRVRFRYWEDNRKEEFRYDQRGLAKHVDRLGLSTDYTRDAFGRIRTTDDGASRRVSVDYAGNARDGVAALHDGNGNPTRWTYNMLGLPESKVQATSEAESYAYDPRGLLTNKTSFAGHSIAQVRDANGNILRTDWDGVPVAAWSYDPANRPTGMVDRLGVTAWAYSPLGWPVSEVSPASSHPVTVAHDAWGRITNVSYAGYSWNYVYDAIGRMVSLAAPEGNYGFQYLANGWKRERIYYPNGMRECRYYDLMKRVEELVFSESQGTRYAARYGYDANDRIVRECWTGRGTNVFGYDGSGQLLSASNGTRALGRMLCAYDDAGNMVWCNRGGFTCDLRYDALNRPGTMGCTAGVVAVAGAVNYGVGTVTVNGVTAQLYPDGTFEAVGVPLEGGSNTLTAVYHGPAFTNTAWIATDKVEVVVSPGEAFAYDADGNLLRDGTFAYSYDAAAQLTSVVAIASGQVVLQVEYDGLGRRKKVTRGEGAVELYVYWPRSMLLLAVLDGSGAIKELFTRGPDLGGSLEGAGGIGGLLAQRTWDAGRPVDRFLHADLVGNIRFVTNPQRTEIATFQYDPFGNLVSSTGDASARHLFSSKEYDAETGLYYYGYRYYSPRLCKWLTRDPIGESGGINLTRFAGNNPVGMVDPWGREAYVVYREFNSPVLKYGYSMIGHIFLAFDGQGVDESAWGNLTRSLGGQLDPLRYVNPDAETFSFHPWSVRVDNQGVRDTSGDLASSFFTAGSYVGYDDDVDRYAFRFARDGGSMPPNTARAMIFPLGSSQEQQFHLYEAAVRSRDINNVSKLSTDSGWYAVLVNNCGTWARKMVETHGRGLRWPSAACRCNVLGAGIGGVQDYLPITYGLTAAAAAYGATVGLAVQSTGGEYTAGVDDNHAYVGVRWSF